MLWIPEKFEMKKVLLFGGRGLVGRHIYKVLKDTYEELSSYMVTDCSLKKLSALVDKYIHYTLDEIIIPDDISKRLTLLFSHPPKRSKSILSYGFGVSGNTFPRIVRSDASIKCRSVF